MKNPSLYDFPEIYGTLLAPEDDLLEDIDGSVDGLHHHF